MTAFISSEDSDKIVDYERNKDNSELLRRMLKKKKDKTVIENEKSEEKDK